MRNQELRVNPLVGCADPNREFATDQHGRFRVEPASDLVRRLMIDENYLQLSRH